MPTFEFFQFETPWAGAAALLIVCATGVLAWKRRPAVPQATIVCMAAAMAALVTAAAGLVWNRPVPASVDVWVDLSPSTRTAAFRDRAELLTRVRRLVAGVPFKLRFFARGEGTLPSDLATLPDLPTSRTEFLPSDAAAALLFSDGRFAEPEFVPPLYAVIDPALERVTDAAVRDIAQQGKSVTTSVHNSGASRVLTIDGVTAAMRENLATGDWLVAREPKADASRVVAQLSGGDAWPENDRLALPLAAREPSERWWVGNSPPDSSWRAFNLADLPSEPAAYLAPQVIVLDDLLEQQFSAAAQERLIQYVRDLGGGVISIARRQLLSEQPVQSLLPLSGEPPEPVTHWMLLADASGSMSGDAGGQSRWQAASQAIAGLIPKLPPADLFSAADFSAGAHWWHERVPVGSLARVVLPPPTITPGGPTNLRSALEAAADRADASLPNELIVMTDGDAELASTETLRRRLAERHVRLHVLAVGPEPSAKLRQLTAATGGTWREQVLPSRWLTDLRAVYQGARPDRRRSQPTTATFLGPLSAVSPVRIEQSQLGWAKERATLLAKDDSTPLAALWRVGEGQVAAFAFDPPAAALNAILAQIARPSGDPRFAVEWLSASPLSVRVDAQSSAGYLNDRSLTLTLVDEVGQAPITRPIPQTAPGSYELQVDYHAGGFATLRVDGHVVETKALPERYPPEFDEVGNDRAALQSLATRSGGRVIEPGDVRPIELPRRRRRIALAPWLSACGACLIAAGLLSWRRGRAT